jgi:hypothetical protein
MPELEIDPSLGQSLGPPATIGQGLLFSDEIESLVQAEEERGRYTGERLRVRRPEAFQAVLELLACNVGMLKIGRILGVHHLTVAAVRNSEAERIGEIQDAIDIANKRLVVDLGTAIAFQVERLLEYPGLVPMTHVSKLITDLIGSRQLLAGLPTARVESYQAVDVHAPWDDLVADFVSEKELAGARALAPGSVREIQAEPPGSEPPGSVDPAQDGFEPEKKPAYSAGTTADQDPAATGGPGPELGELELDLAPDPAADQAQAQADQAELVDARSTLAPSDGIPDLATNPTTPSPEPSDLDGPPAPGSVGREDRGGVPRATRGATETDSSTSLENFD